MIRSSLFRALLLLGGVGALASCSDVEPVGVEDEPLTPAFSVQGDVASPAVSGEIVSGGYVVAVRPGAFDALSSAIADLGGTVVRGHSPAGIIVASGLSNDDAAHLATLRGVRAVALDIIIDGVPDAPGPSVESLEPGAGPAAHDPSQASFYQAGVQWDMEIIQADDAWAAGADGSGVTVAILDTGIDPFHPDLQGLVDEGRSVAFVPNADPSIPPWADDHFHGTHVAGTVVTNGIGTSGVAPHTTLMAVKVCGAFFGCPFSAMVSGILHASDNGADIVNMSLRGLIGRRFPGGGELSAVLGSVMNYASQKGVVVVSAAGNDSFDLDHLAREFGPVAASFIITPCESGNGVCVSSTGPTDLPAVYTNYGTSAISVAAPGGDISVTGVPATSVILAPCSTVSVYLPTVAGFSCGPLDYLFLQGTSMASPHVAGAAAVLAGAGVESPGRIRTALERTADDLGPRGADPFFGKGRINVLELITR